MENHRSTNKAKINTTVDVNQISQETSAFDYAAHVEIQVNRKAYREAIRLYHLWCLDVLNSQKIIQYHSDKTNLDYLYDIKEKKLFEAFRYLTYIYDNIWFGAHPLDDYTFSQAKIPYDLFIQKLYTS